MKEINGQRKYLVAGSGALAVLEQGCGHVHRAPPALTQMVLSRVYLAQLTIVS